MHKLLIVNLNIIFDNKTVNFENINKLYELKEEFKIGIVSKNIEDYFLVNELNLLEKFDYVKCVNSNIEFLVNNVINYLRIKFDFNNYKAIYLDNDNENINIIEEKMNIDGIYINDNIKLYPNLIMNNC